jgi:DNA invertase Pin-like site-specific DNA recombinase
MAIFGYIRCSSASQNLDRQHIALAPYGIPARNLYVDQVSGKDFNRPAYKKLIKRLRRGDLLIIKAVDRLGRSYTDLTEQWRLITKTIGTDIKVIDMPLLDTTFGRDLLGTFIADLVLSVLSLNAQLERDFLLQRQAEGFAAAKARGVRLGKAPIPLPEDFEEIYFCWQSGILTVSEAAALCEMSVCTLYEKTQERRRSEQESNS